MKTHMLRAGQFVEFILPVKGMKHMNIMHVRSSHNIHMFHSFHGYDEFNKLACSQRMGLHSSKQKFGFIKRVE